MCSFEIVDIVSESFSYHMQLHLTSLLQKYAVRGITCSSSSGGGGVGGSGDGVGGCGGCGGVVVVRSSISQEQQQLGVGVVRSRSSQQQLVVVVRSRSSQQQLVVVVMSSSSQEQEELGVVVYYIFHNYNNLH